MTTRLLTVLVCLLGTVVAFSRTAAAQNKEVEVLFTVKPPDPNNPKTKDDAPQIEATVIGAPNLEESKFFLKDNSAKVPVELKAVSKRLYNQGNEPLALAIVMNGWEAWIGNDVEVPEVAQDAPDRYPGVLIGLRAALDKVNFANAGPPGSVGTVIIYADTVTERVKMGPLSNITGGALGTQKDYFGTTGRNLAAGVGMGITRLSETQAARKVLIVICDGSDTNNETAKAELTAMKKQAQQQNIQTFAIIYRGAMSEQGVDVISSMIKNPQTVNNAEAIAAAVEAVLARMNDRQYLVFNGFDKKLKKGLIWDGKPHELAVRYEKEETPGVEVTLSPIWNASAPEGFPWLVLILALVGLLLLIVIGIKVFGGKPAPAPVEVAPAAAAPMMASAPEAPKPMGPAKTVMFSVGGGDEGFPIVGWLVATNGPDAYKTYRLRSGGTKIGTSTPADIVVNDGFMSTDHCMIQCSMQGFTLVDGGSTNGCYVNDRKVSKQDLVDNDVVTLGKTTFRFKSIN